MKLTDDSPMPFGKEHYGKRMEDVPAQYLLWCYEKIANLRADVKAYIEDNMHVLVMQAKPKMYGK